MGPAYSIVTEQPIDGFDQFAEAQALAFASDLLDRLATDAGVRPLMDFFSMDPTEADALFDDLVLADSEEAAGSILPLDPDSDDDLEPDSGEIDLKIRELAAEESPAEEWYDPQEGLTTVRALIAAVTALPGPLDPDDPKPETILTDLRAFETVFNTLSTAGVRWHLSVVF